MVKIFGEVFNDWGSVAAVARERQDTSLLIVTFCVFCREDVEAGKHPRHI